MRKLHLVGLTTDRDGLIFTARKGSKSGGYIVPLDKRVLAAIAAAGQRDNGEADESRVPASDIEAVPRRLRSESALTPREMQARLRAGRTIDEVAAEAGVDHEWVARFAVPILAEQAQVVELARGLVYAKPRLGDSTESLGNSVMMNLTDRGVFLPDDVANAAWSAFQLHDSVWMVRYRYRSRGRDQEAHWEIDVPTGRLRARNRQASDLGYVGPDRWRTAADLDDQPPADEAPPPPLAGRRRPAPAPSRAQAKAAPAKRPAAKAVPATRPAAKRAVKAPAPAPSRAQAKAAPAKSTAAPAKRPAATRPTAKATPAKRPAATRAAKATPAKATPAKRAPATRAAKATPAKATPAKRPAKATATEPRRRPAGAVPARTPKGTPARTAKAPAAKKAPARKAATRSAPRPAAAKSTTRRRPTKAVPAPEAGPTAGSGGVRMAVAQVSTARVAASMAAAEREPWAAAVRGAGAGGRRPTVKQAAPRDRGVAATPAVAPFQPRPLPPPGSEPLPPRVRKITVQSRPAVGPPPDVSLPAPRRSAQDTDVLPVADRPKRRRLRSR